MQRGPWMDIAVFFYQEMLYFEILYSYIIYNYFICIIMSYYFSDIVVEKYQCTDILSIWCLHSVTVGVEFVFLHSDHLNIN